MSTWKSTELCYDEAQKLKSFLNQAKIKYESSGCYNLIHFEIFANDFEAELVNCFIDTL